MKSSEIRQAFFDFFSQREHHIVPSSSLIPGNDPTLLFTNAGMVQFKDTFLGLESRAYQRAVSSQRCLRAGGKHNDLDNVGYTARHHTFFEMLGNFSFGDYFKQDAIHYAWEFLTQVLKLPQERLWVSVYTDDDEAADIWLKDVGVSSKRFSRCGEKDNFWSMGDTGPCGPCTEIFYDHGPDIAGGPPGSPDQEGDRYIEIWNLVFMQYNRDKQGVLHPLPHPSVDTGMGLERIAAVVQGVHSNYDIDLFQNLIKAIVSLKPGLSSGHVSLKVIADHIRACAFLIADGVMPSNEGRGYVLRRIIRRAVRHGHALELPSPFFGRIVKALVSTMGEAYPELKIHQKQIEKILDQEESQFNRTLEHGLKLLQEEIEGLSGKNIPGDVAFKLYDTYGFPVDLTADIAREKDLQVDMEGFNRCMQQQRQLSQSASQFNVDYNNVAQLVHDSEFHGYEKDIIHSKVIALLVDGKTVETLNQDDKGAIVLDHTPFYAESGGQVGDKGIISDKTMSFRVDDTQRMGSAIVHFGEVLKGQVKLDLEVEALVDSERRNAIRLNHTATHLLHAALKEVVGTHVQQKGSLVDADRARFDFSSFEPVSPQQLRQIEHLVNDNIRSNDEVVTDIMPIEEAQKSGAVALFGEKYSEKVRVLSIGDFSKELCGGTHAKRTGDIGLFKIVAEYGVASGVRRIEILTGKYALEWVGQQQEMLEQIAAVLKTSLAKAGEKALQFVQDNKRLEKEVSQLKVKVATSSGTDLSTEIEKINGIELLIKRMDGMDMKGMRALIDQLKSKLQSAVILLYAVEGDKISVISGVSKSLLGQVPSAASLVQHLCGKGGGREDMAQGGGVVPDNLDERISDIKAMVSA